MLSSDGSLQRGRDCRTEGESVRIPAAPSIDTFEPNERKGTGQAPGLSFLIKYVEQVGSILLPPWSKLSGFLAPPLPTLSQFFRSSQSSCKCTSLRS